MGKDKLTLDKLLALEHRGWDSLCRQQGGSFYGSIMTPEAVMILVNGMVLDTPTIAATLNDSPAWSSYTLDDARCIATGETSSVLIYRATATRAGQTEPFAALMSSHYTLVDGEPMLAVYQQTALSH